MEITSPATSEGIGEKTTPIKVKKQYTSDIEKNNYNITLALILVGNNPASEIYVRNKNIACQKVGIKVKGYTLNEEISEEELLKIIEDNNKDDSVNGILVQMPLPKHIDEIKVINAINPLKDVDGLTVINQGKLMGGLKTIPSATPKGVITLLKKYNIEISGKNVVVVGRSILVGKPLSLLFLQENATVTICHSRTRDLGSVTRQADILVAAIGKPKFFTSEMVKEGAVVVDVGINRVDGKICGDVDFEEVSKKASFITPVPKGVGPMTIASLLENIIDCYKMQKNIY